jgi:hypothetical protein
LAQPRREKLALAGAFAVLSFSAPHFMRFKRTLPLLLAVLIIAAAVVTAVQLRKHAPPEAARLLPTADAFVYADFSWLHKITSAPLPTVSRDPEYEQFVRETGFEFERDLESVAVAVHYPAGWPGGGTAGAAPEPRFSEVFVGKFNGERLGAYLRRTASSVDNYNSVDIYTIRLQGRTFRVAILSVDSVAASNNDDPGVIRGMIDRSRRLASPFGGPALLRRYYKHVPWASPVWGIARVEPSAPAFEGWSAVFSKPADLVISASYNPLHLPLHAGALRLRAEVWAGTDEVAHDITDKASAFLANFHTAELSVGTPGSDADVKALFDSLQVRQENTCAVLSATLPTGIFKKLLESPSQSAAPVSTEPVNSH